MSSDTQQPNNSQASQASSPNTDQSATSASKSPTSGNAGYQSGEDARISSPKYWLTVCGVSAVYILLGVVNVLLKTKIMSLVALLIALVVLIICYRNISKLKAAGKDILTKEEKLKMVFFMSFVPVIAQAFYYYRLNKSLPQTARTALKIGWKVFILVILISILSAL